MDEPVSIVNGLFSTEQITSITTALGTAIENVMTQFVALLPIMATIAAVGFGIALVRGLFNRVSNGN